MKTDMKAKLRRHEMCIGTHVSLNEAVVTEMMGYLPYDYLWIDMEHSVINTERLLGQLIAARASGINAIVRIPANDPILAKPVLDAGADGIIFPMIRGYDDAARAMEACMYPPRGVRGYGPWRAYRFGTINGADYRATVDDTLLRFIQIEEMGAIRELIGSGTVFGISVFGASYEPMLLLVLPAGGFLVFGLMLASINIITGKFEARRAQKAAADGGEEAAA